MLVPDSRRRYREVGPGSLKGVHGVMAERRLNDRVPQDIQNHVGHSAPPRRVFVVRDPFVMPAQSHAYGTLEYALRVRLDRADDECPRSCGRCGTWR